MSFSKSSLHVKGLELNLTDHCNLRCGNCHHASPHLEKFVTPISVIEKDLQAILGILSSDEIRLVGGEPLIHPDLLELIRIVRESGISNKIVLISNGVLLDRVPDLLWESIDELRISVYPGVKYTWRPEDLKARCKANGVKLKLLQRASFQIILLNQKIPDHWARFIYRNCYMAHRWSCHLVHLGKFYICPIAPFMKDRLNLLGHSSSIFEKDSVVLFDNPNLCEHLEIYLANKSAPLDACSYCLGNIGKDIPNRQLNKQDRSSVLEESHSDFLNLIAYRRLVKSLVKKPGTGIDLIQDVADRWNIR